MSTKLSQLGEFGLIDLLKKHQGSGTPVVKGIGDDTAVVVSRCQEVSALTTDMSWKACILSA